MPARAPLAWLQLSYGRVKLIVAVAGVVVAVLLMLMQLGFMQAAFESALIVPRQIDADLIVVSPQSQAMFRTSPFPRRLLYRLPAVPGVESVRAVYLGTVPWHNPWKRNEQSIFVYGFEPGDPPLKLPGLAENWPNILQTDAVIYDAKSKPIFGPVAESYRRGENVEVEVNRRRVHVVGLAEAGNSFGIDGNLFTSDLNFFRMFPQRNAGGADLGLIHVEPGVDPKAVQGELQKLLGVEARVLTHQEFLDFEHGYWARSSPVGFVFTLGAVVGFCIGFVIVYQILYTDVSNHLSQYATMKAMGFTDSYLVRLVLKEAVILAGLGYWPGVLLAWGLYEIARAATALPLDMTWQRVLGVFITTLVMCLISGVVAVRRLRAAQPADVF
ncbi:ABC transporter permease DevC [Lacipirellula sp.]|uniref:ABC transporter permease DevC n=1 Tax=Lacipirellula sp. TaxID=2691419 RepID=UPI003D09AC51